MINAQLYRPLWIPALVAAMHLMVALGLLVTMSWRSLARVQPVHAHAAQLAQLRVVSVLFVGFPLLGLLVLYLLRHRILNPLRNLGMLLGLLAEREYSPAPAAGVDPLLRPLFDSYNELVQRPQELERQHREREHTPEQDVRAATQTLLDQSRALARSERLAAVGEVAAGLAHELPR